jgi:phenylalanyl-tRNA synthetase beta chain
LGIDINKIESSDQSLDILSEGLTYSYNTKELVNFGTLPKKILKSFDIDTPVYYAEFNWDHVVKQSAKSSIRFTEIPKYPEVRRDLALLLDKSVTFKQIQDLATKTEKKLLKKVSLFDVFEGDQLGENKKSYAVSFILQDENKTLTDKQIDKIMNKFIQVFEKELNAQIR